MLKFVCYPHCTTCKRARDFLDKRDIAYEERDIATENPTVEELSLWLDRSGLTPDKLFNTSGIRYRSQGLKAKIPTMTREEALEILSSDGMLVRRPVLVGEDFVLFGFKESEWNERVAE